MKSLVLLVGVLAGLGSFGAFGQSLPLVVQQHDVKVSPFDGLRWSGDQPEVNLGETWYQPIGIDGVTVESILEFCDKRWPRERQKRFGEDLGEALHLMGHEVGKTAKLELKQLSDGEEVTLDAVAMTRAKRTAIRNANRTKGEQPADSVGPPKSVPLDVALGDIAAFGDGLRTQFAYLETKGVDLDAELERIVEGHVGQESVDAGALASELQRVMYLFGDGHARVRASVRPEQGLHLPFLLDSAGDGVVAFDPRRKGLVDPKRPYVQSIDGMPIADWVDAMRPLVVDGSPQLIQHRALRAMRELEVVRQELGREASDSVTLVLSSKPNGGTKEAVEMALQERRPTYGSWPLDKTRLLEGKDAKGRKGGIGVIRLPQMEDELIPALRKSMGKFKDTHGLIVDVRGNGGGRRGLCAALAGYLVKEGAEPVVGNCAAYRLAPRFKEDHLGGSRLLYRAGDGHWSSEQKAAIDAFAADFKPEWTLPSGFSEWHYLVLDRTGHSDEYFYERPVVVLVDEGCFSATDIFVAALGALPNVTLMGTATGGGSARSSGFELPSTGIRVTCASMASFQPNGKLYDGNGVEVDVEVQREPSDLVNGGGDAQLEAAIQWLAKQR